MKQYNVAIIGCGLIGNKRAQALKKIPTLHLSVVTDTNRERAEAMAKEFGCSAETDWKTVVHNPQIEIVIIATIHNVLSEIACAAVAAGKHVLIEKPAGRTVQEIQKIIDAKNTCTLKNPKVKVGFNHRFHPGVQKAREIIATENIGNIMFIRARYGHGGRIGYDKEWRASKEIAGGGELIDQGSHLIDLSRYLVGSEFPIIKSMSETLFWNMEVEDNTFALLKNEKNQIVQFHVSCTAWKNIFCFEISCRTGLIVIDGLGRSYGTETVTFYKMKPEMGIPDKMVYTFPEEDQSWELELKDLIDAIEKNREPNGNLKDALESMKIIQHIYKENEKKA